MESLWVGIDVSGKELEVFIRPTEQRLTVANSPAGLAVLVKELLAFNPKLIVVEATANWHVPAVSALSGAGLPVAVINPRQARDFARASGQLAKTGASQNSGRVEMWRPQYTSVYFYSNPGATLKSSLLVRITQHINSILKD